MIPRSAPSACKTSHVKAGDKMVLCRHGEPQKVVAVESVTRSGLIDARTGTAARLERWRSDGRCQGASRSDPRRLLPATAHLMARVEQRALLGEVRSMATTIDTIVSDAEQTPSATLREVLTHLKLAHSVLVSSGTPQDE